jgi:hypothetical protein
MPTNSASLRISRARAAAEMADRSFDRIAHPSHVSLEAALDLYRQAAFWALTANRADPLPASVASALTSADRAILDAGGPDDASRATVVRILGQTFVEDVDEDDPQLIRQVELTRDFVRRVIRYQERALPARASIDKRVIVGSVLGAAAVLAAILAASPRDLARNRPWKASSVEPTCDFTYRVCGGRLVDVFFHTLDEDSPWVMVDLGEPKTVSTVAIANRPDCCKERPVPLAIEVSDDGRVFREVARQDAPFETWRAHFPSTTARFVRARSMRKTVLHFESMSVYR